MRALAVLLAVGLLLVAGCGDDEENEPKDVGTAQFEVTIPKEWFDAKDLGENEEFRDEVERFGGSEARNAQFALLAASRDPVDGFAANLNVINDASGLPESLSVEEYEQRQRRGLEQLYERSPELRPSDVAPIRKTEVAGEPAVQTEVTRVVDGRRIRQRQIFVLHEGSGFAITYTAVVRDFEDKLPQANELIESWRWK